MRSLASTTVYTDRDAVEINQAVSSGGRADRLRQAGAVSQLALSPGAGAARRLRPLLGPRRLATSPRRRRQRHADPGRQRSRAHAGPRHHPTTTSAQRRRAVERAAFTARQLN